MDNDIRIALVFECLGANGLLVGRKSQRTYICAKYNILLISTSIPKMYLIGLPDVLAFLKYIGPLAPFGD